MNLAKEYADIIGKLHELINSDKRGNYSVSNWVECLASLHYLRRNVLSFNASKQAVIEELEKRKPHLNNRNVNDAAYQLVENLF